MAKQTFTTGQVLTAAQMTSLQQTAMLGGAASAKTASYTLVAADAGTAISMSSASATTITVNTALFAAGDTVQITNLGVGVCTITAGTATVNTSASLALAQYESGTLDFTSTSAAIFIKGAGAAASAGKVLQVVTATTSTEVSTSTTGTFTDSGLTASITPSSASSRIAIFITEPFKSTNSSDQFCFAGWRIVRDSTEIYLPSASGNKESTVAYVSVVTMSYVDSPSTTSSTTYKLQGYLLNAQSSTGRALQMQANSSTASIILMEIGA